MKCDMSLTRNYTFGRNLLREKCGIFLFLLGPTCYNARVTCRYLAGEKVHLASGGAPDDGLVIRGGVNTSGWKRELFFLFK